MIKDISIITILISGFVALSLTLFLKKTPLTLTLNIPKFINLHGYGYRNVFELNELLSIIAIQELSLKEQRCSN